MKRLVGLLLTGIVAAMCLPAIPGAALSCTNVSTYGAVQLNVPALPRPGDYSIWLRMQAPFQGAQLYLDINQENCWVAVTEDAPVNRWYWQGFTDNGTTQPYRFGTAAGNSLTVIGVDNGIKVDKVIVTEPDCVPQDFGDNCSSGVIVQPEALNSITKLQPPEVQPVQGSVVVSKTPFNKSSNLVEVRYIVGGRVVQYSVKAVAFDTTRLPNGKHTVFIETELPDDIVLRESTILEVKNSENFLTPVQRWWKINSASIMPAVVLSFITVGLIGLLYIIRTVYIRRRNLRLRGF